jgi:predicted PurR-regulated permease PerM
LIKIKNTLFFAAFALTALLAFLIVKPFINVIITALVFAYVFYPVYKWLNTRIRHESIASFIIVLLVIFLISVPLVFVLNALTREVFTGYVAIKEKLATGELNEPLAKIYSNEEVRSFVNNSLSSVTNFIISNTSNFVFILSQKLLYVFILFFLVYYILKDSKKFVKFSTHLHLKLTRRVHQPLIDRLNDTIYAVVYGTIIVAIIQGIVAGAGFYFLGAPSPVLFGVLTIIFALIPFLGAVAIWLPLSVFVTINGYLNSSSWGIASGIILFLYGLLVISMIDNILKPKIIGSRAKIHPALVLIGVIGGLNVFGMVGIVIGPVLLALLVTFFEIYGKERLTWN